MRSFYHVDERLAVLLDRKGAAEEVTSGKNVVVFPEGTRGREYALRPFKKGPFVLAIAAGVWVFVEIADEVHEQAEMVQLDTSVAEFLHENATADLTRAIRVATWMGDPILVLGVGAKVTVPGNHDVPLYNVFARFLNPLTKFRKYITDDLTPEYVDNELAIFGVNTARSLTILTCCTPDLPGKSNSTTSPLTFTCFGRSVAIPKLPFSLA